MLTRNQLTAILGFAVFVWAVALVLGGVAVSLDYLRPFTVVVGVVMLALGAFERWLWKWRLFNPWLVSTPDLSGTWMGTFKSDFIQEDGTLYPETVCFLVVRQSLASLSVRLITNRSNSKLLWGAFEEEKDGLKALVGVYKAEPGALDYSANPPHDGAMILRLIGKPPRELVGLYWTNRSSKGDLRLTAWVKEHAETYEEGFAAFGVSDLPSAVAIKGSGNGGHRQAQPGTIVNGQTQTASTGPVTPDET